MVRYIPLELVHLIASSALVLDRDSSKEDRRARFALAKSLSLVCREWRHVGQAALFRKVYLYPGQPNHKFLRTRQHHLLSHVRELDVEADAGSARLDSKISRCRRDCDKLRRVRLLGQGAFSAWFSPASKVSPAESVVEVILLMASFKQDWIADMSAAMSGSRQFPNARDVSLVVSSTSHVATFPDFQGSTLWAAVSSLQLVVDLPVGPHGSLMRALPHVFPIGNLTIFILSIARASTALCPILREATALEILNIGVAAHELSSFALGMAPALAVMSRLGALSIRPYTRNARSGGRQPLLPSFLAKLPLSLAIADLDLTITVGARTAFEAFLAQRLQSTLASCTTTRLGSDEAETWNKVERDGTSVWERE